MAINYYHVIQNCYYMSNDEELIEKIAYVLASQHRTNILDYMGYKNRYSFTLKD